MRGRSETAGSVEKGASAEAGRPRSALSELVMRRSAEADSQCSAAAGWPRSAQADLQCSAEADL